MFTLSKHSSFNTLLIKVCWAYITYMYCTYRVNPAWLNICRNKWKKKYYFNCKFVFNYFLKLQPTEGKNVGSTRLCSQRNYEIQGACLVNAFYEKTKIPQLQITERCQGLLNAARAQLCKTWQLPTLKVFSHWKCFGPHSLQISEKNFGY